MKSLGVAFHVLDSTIFSHTTMRSGVYTYSLPARARDNPDLKYVEAGPGGWAVEKIFAVVMNRINIEAVIAK